MDYRIFNMCTFVCVRIHTGVGHTDESAQHFDLEKLTNFSCASDGIQTSGHGIHWISKPTLYQLSHHVSLHAKVTLVIHELKRVYFLCR